MNRIFQKLTAGGKRRFRIWGLGAVLLGSGLGEAVAGGIGNLIFRDIDRNRRYNDGDQPAKFVDVQLYAAGQDPYTEEPLAATETDLNGHYFFGGLADGNYFVFIPPTVFTTAGDLLNTRSAPGTRGAVDSDDDVGENGLDPVDPRIHGVRSTTVVLAAGTAPVSDLTESGEDFDSDYEEDADVDLTVDFGFQEFMTRVGDFVWLDENRNGLQDPGEPGIEGVEVQIFTAENEYAATAITEVDGFFSLGGMAAGNYYLSFPTVPPGLKLTVAEQDPQDLRDSDANVATGHTPVFSLLVNEQKMSLDAGYVVKRASVGDFVFADINADGIQDAGELGLAGVAVELYTEAGVLVASTETGENGSYLFEEVDPGNYYLQFPDETQGGQVLSAQDQSFDEEFDSDPDRMTGMTPVFTVEPGEQAMKWDAGYHAPPAAIKGSAWHDENKNGLQDAGEPGIPGVRVELLAFDFVVDSRVTDEEGKYRFSDLLEQPRKVRFAPVAGVDLRYQLTVPDAGMDDALDSDAEQSAGVTPEVTPMNGEQIVMDAGYTLIPLGIGNGVWVDVDGNGRFNLGEGVGQVKLELYRAGDTAGVSPPVANATSSSTGIYEFKDLRPGDYFVWIPASEFQSNRPLAGMISRSGNGSDNGVDDNVAGENGMDQAWPAGTGIRSNAVKLESGKEPLSGIGNPENGRSPEMDSLPGAENDSNVDLTVDFGFVKGVTIGNLVYADLNGDKAYNTNEGVNGVKVELYVTGKVPGTDAPVGSVTTAGGGFYQFRGLMSDSYFVHLPAVNFQAGQALAGHTSLTGAGLLATADDNVDENGLDNPAPEINGISSRVFPLSPGTAPTQATGETGAGSAVDDGDDSNGLLTVDFGFVPGLPATYLSWQQRFLPAGNNAPDQDADGDGLSNGLEYVMNLPPSGGTALQQPLQLEADPVTGRIDAVLLLNPLAADSQVVLTWRADLRDGAGNWTVVSGITPADSPQPGGMVQRRWQDLESVPGLAGGVGFVRAGVTLDTDTDSIADHTFQGTVMGWRDRTHANGLTTSGSAFLRPSVFSGTVSSAAGTALTLSASVGDQNLRDVFPAGVACYAEITSGTWMGHRFEIDEAGTSGVVLQLLSSSPLHTLGTVPDLSGAALAIRPHWTLAGLFPPSKFHATADPATADQIMTYPRPTFSSYWLVDAGTTKKWVRTDDSALADAGTRIIPPGEGLFVQRRSTALTVLDLGEVRPHRMARVLTAGYTLQTSGWPVPGSPATWGMLAVDGFTGSANPAQADAFQVWGADAPGGATAFRSFFLLHAQAPWQFWAEKSDSLLNNQNENLLFPSGAAVFLQLKNTVNNSFEPSPWTP